jgi:hypothetical protein
LFRRKELTRDLVPDEEAVRKYIREQEGWDRQQGELFE